jgi:hypothetical protein
MSVPLMRFAVAFVAANLVVSVASTAAAKTASDAAKPQAAEAIAAEAAQYASLAIYPPEVVLDHGANMRASQSIRRRSCSTMATTIRA